MPIHDWTRVHAGTFHDFHQTWIVELKRALNASLLPPEYYALAEQRTGDFGPEVLTLQGPVVNEVATEVYAASKSLQTIDIADQRPAVRLHVTAEIDWYARKADTVTIRHVSDHRVVAVIEIVSPGNKSSRPALAKFVEKTVELLNEDVHSLVVDLFPPGRIDPDGIHGVIWEECTGESFDPPKGTPLTLAAYIGGGAPEAYVEPTAVGSALIDMPLFLERDRYVPTPLETTYQSAWEAVPAIWRKVLEDQAARA